MALQINCSICNGHIEPDDLAIRRKIVTCPYCSTVNRIVATGTEKVNEPISKRFVPKTVKIDRSKPNALLIHIDQSEIASGLNEINKGLSIFRQIGTWVFIIPALIVLCMVGYFMIDTVFASFLYRGVLLGIWVATFFLGILFAIWFLIFFAVRQFSQLKAIPPLRVEGNYLYPALNDSKSVPLATIRQIFTTSTKFEYPTATQIQQMFPDAAQEIDSDYDVDIAPHTYCTLFALIESNERVPLVRSLAKEEVALYIEEMLESELGLYNLPVLGEYRGENERTQLVKNTVNNLQSDDTSFTCFSCGGILQETEYAEKQGYNVCEYCHSLTLLYKPDSPLPILGMPDVYAPVLQIKLIENASKFGLVEKVNGSLRQRVQMEPKHIAAQQMDGAVQVVPISDLNKVYVQSIKTKEALGLQDLEGINIKEISEILQDIGREVAKEEAYSGNIDPLMMMRRAGAGLQYRIVAEVNDGTTICLLDNIVDVREAVLWAEFICEKCGVDNAETHHLL